MTVLPFRFSVTFRCEGVIFKTVATIEAPDPETAWELMAQSAAIKLEPIPDLIVDAEIVG